MTIVFVDVVFFYYAGLLSPRGRPRGGPEPREQRQDGVERGMYGAVSVSVSFFCRLQRVRRLHELREEKRVRRGEAPEKIVAGDGATRRASGRRVRHVHAPDNLREQSGVRQRRAVAHLRCRRAANVLYFFS